MIPAFPLWAKISGSIIGILAAGGFFLMQAKSLVDVGVDLANARWEAELAKKELEAQAAIEAAREAGRAEGVKALKEAETRSASALRALAEARNADPKFDEVLRTDWPDSYFASVCGEAECLPQD